MSFSAFATQEQLAASQRMDAVGQLSRGIAHDFNNLLMIIIGNLERAQRGAQALGANAANLQRSIAHAMRGAQRAATLTNRLLAFSRRQPLSPKVLDLNKYLPGVAEFLQRALGETIELEVAGAPALWPIEVDNGSGPQSGLWLRQTVRWKREDLQRARAGNDRQDLLSPARRAERRR
jgi:signal transduction histidine kinase